MQTNNVLYVNDIMAFSQILAKDVLENVFEDKEYLDDDDSEDGDMFMVIWVLLLYPMANKKMKRNVHVEGQISMIKCHQVKMKMNQTENCVVSVMSHH